MTDGRPRESHSPRGNSAGLLSRYGLAVASTALAGLLRWLLPWALSPAPYLGFYPAVVVSAALGGVGPGLVSTFGSLLLVNLVFVQFNLSDSGAIARQFIWVTASVGVSLLAGMQRAARMREREQAEALRESERALQQSHEQLELRVHERTQELSRVNEVLRDRIDQHTKTLEELRESAASLAEAQHMAHLGDWNWDYAGSTAHWSDETFRLLGYEPQAVEPSFEHFIQRVHPEDRQQAEASLRAAVVRQEGAFRAAFRVVLSGDELRHLSAQAETVYSEDGKPVRLAGTLMDITEQVRAREEANVRNQQLLQADKMVSLGILTSGVAHEINNPNHTIMSNTNLLADAWASIHPILERAYGDMGDFIIGGFDYSKGREEYPKMLRDIMSASRRIEGIVTELRDFARYSPEETLSPIDIQPVIGSAAALLSSMIKKSTDHFSVSCEENLPAVIANRQRIEQVLINLIQNACQALSGRDKGVTVSASRSAENGTVLIVVSDEGAGISKENLKRLGDPFFTTKRHLGGTGLGLWVSFNIVREHGGTLEFFSKPGEGTRAVLTLRASAEG